MWWIVFIVSAAVLSYLVYNFGLCASIVEAFKFTATYATTIIGTCLGALIAGVSYVISSMVKKFIDFFK
jgi:hypothetical protein